VLHPGYPFTYLRGDGHLVTVNPRREPASVTVAGAAGARPLLARGVRVAGDEVSVDGFGYGILELSRR
jgi:maltose alpha-D-glucosyltransferase/alpha-amylase